MKRIIIITLLTFTYLLSQAQTKQVKPCSIDPLEFSEQQEKELNIYCFTKGSLVTMADGTTKPIEEISAGDEVMAYDLENFTPTAAAVENIVKATHTHLVKYSFNNGADIIATHDHPFMVRAKGWSSLNTEQTKRYKGFENVSEVKVGDGFFTINSAGTLSPVTLVKIEELNEEQETYTISKLSKGNNFLIERFIVGVEQPKE